MLSPFLSLTSCLYFLSVSFAPSTSPPLSLSPYSPPSLPPLPDAGYEFDVCYTSVLKRAVRTLWLVLEGIDQMWLPVHRTWRLNERHYGGLTGLNKAETAAKHGEAQVKVWRRSFDTPPPPMDEDHDFYNNISKVQDRKSTRLNSSH